MPLQSTTIFAAAPVLIADWTAVIWLVVIAVGVLNQLLGGDKKKQPPKRPPQPNQGGAKNILDEVERFLQEARKATEQAQNRPPKQQQPVAPLQPQQPRRTPQQSEQQQREQWQRKAAQRKQQQQQREAAAKKKAQQEAAARKKVPLAERQLQSKLELSSEEETFRGTVSEHVQQHLDTSRFDERAGRLSQLQKTVEQDIGGHVKSVFDHQVGTLAKADAGGQTVVAATPAEQIAALLREPQHVATAIVLQEVLRPPVERW
jgi:hypothetical protein